MANFGGHFQYSYEAYPLVSEEEEEEAIDIKPLLVGGVLRPNPRAVPTPGPSHNFESPHTSPPPLRPSPSLVIRPDNSPVPLHAGQQLPAENAPDAIDYDDDFQDVVLLSSEDNVLRPEGGRFDCRICGQNCDNDESRLIHERLHSRDRPFVCSYCDRTFSFKHSMLRHQRTVHREEIPEGLLPPNPSMPPAEVHGFREAPEVVPMTTAIEPPRCSTSQVEAAPPPIEEKSDLICKHCGSRFMNKNTLIMHEKMHTGEPPFRCSFCSKGFSFELSMIRHEQFVHGKEALQMPLDLQNSVLNVPATAPSVPLASGLTPIIPEAELKNHQCRYCGKVWRNREYLKIHMRSHTGEQPYKCSYCDVRFSVRTNMLRHERSVHRTEMEKSALPMVQSLPTNPVHEYRPMPNPMNLHEAMFEGPEFSLSDNDPRFREFSCQYCGKVFPEKNRLNIHLRSHTGEQPYKCAHCPMRFSVRGNRNRHEVRVHNFPHTSQAFEPPADRYVTTPKKEVFKCVHCDEAFDTSVLLVKHERRKHFKLRLQKSAQPCKVDLVSGKKTYECCYCQQLFNHVGNMYKHQRRMHAQLFIQQSSSSASDQPSQSSGEAKNRRKRYSCNICTQTFDSQNSVLAHEATDHAQLLGDGCAETLSYSEASQAGFEIKADFNIAIEEAQVKCTCCEATFANRNDMYEHFTQAHTHIFPENQDLSMVSQPEPKRVKLTKFTNAREKTVEKKQQFRCGYCNQVFKYRWNAIQHENTMHPLILPQEPPIPPETSISSFDAKVVKDDYICPHCQQSFTYRQNLLRHIRNLHCDEKTTDSLSDSIQSSSLKQKRSFKCPYCEKSLTRLWGLSRHLKRRHLKFIANEDAERGSANSRRSFQCSFCSCNFTRSVIWRRHEIRRHFKELSERAAEMAVDPLPPDHTASSDAQAMPESCSNPDVIKKDDITDLDQEPSEELMAKASVKTPFSDSPPIYRRHSDEGALKPSYDKLTSDAPKNEINSEPGKEGALEIPVGNLVDHKPIAEQSSHMPTKFSPNKRKSPSKSKWKYRCQYCGLKRLDRYRLIVHERTHTGERPFKCSLCGKGFAERFVMNRHKREVHMKDKSTRKSFQCHVCNARLESALALKEHEQIHSPKLPYDCNFCGRSFETLGRLNKHKGAMHKGYRRVEAAPFKCDFCERSFFSEHQLNQHRNLDHQLNQHRNLDHQLNQHRNLDHQLNQHPNLDHQLNQHPNLDHQLNQHPNLDHQLNQHPNLDHQLNCIKAEELLSCDLCGQAFFSQMQLNHHRCTVRKGGNYEEEEEEESFACEICGKSFSNAGRLSRHKGAVHKGYRRIESFRCDLCPKSFPTLGRLGRHKSTVHKDHSKFEQSFDCNLCEKAFFSLGELNDHRNAVHKGSNEEESFDCDICGKSFPAAGRLSRHKGAVHKGYRWFDQKASFDCNRCDKSFFSARSLIQHKSAKHEEDGDLDDEEKPSFGCNLCDDAFFTEPELVEHKNVEHEEGLSGEEQQFDCNLCDKSFPSSRSLIQHKGAKHKSENPRGDDRPTFDCNQCGRTFVSLIHLNQHQGTCGVNDDANFDCNCCDKSFPSARSLIQHKGAKHKGENHRDKSGIQMQRHTDVDPEKDKAPSEEQPFDCGASGELNAHNDEAQEKVLPKGDTLELPTDQVNQNEANSEAAKKASFDCEICGKAFPERSRLNHHKAAVHKPRGAMGSFRSLSPVRSPVTGRFACSCTFCGLLFPDRRRLNRHLRQHTGSQPFGCSVCGRRFSCSQLLQRHKKECHKEKQEQTVVANPRQYQCTQCCLSFNTEHRLQQHSVVHTTGCRKMTCAVCGACFRAKSSYYEHKKLHF